MMIDLIGGAMLALAQAVGPETAAGAVHAAAAATPGAAAAVAPVAAAAQAAELAAGSQGVLHFIGQSDAVGKSLFVFLLLMSLASWYLILMKGFTHLRIRQRSKKFLSEFWAASSLEQVENEISTHGADEPFARLASHAIHAQKHHAKYGALKLEESGSTAACVTRTIRKVIDEETARLENGLTVLASVGSTAPFVGLFGTVWGVYHALLSISMADGVTINRIAGPVGEALIMTGLGLAVAIPAVLAYNAFVRVNRVYLAQLDAFAHDLFTFLTTGQQVTDGSHERNGRTISLASHRGA